jgi:hypothetical protein
MEVRHASADKTCGSSGEGSVTQLIARDSVAVLGASSLHPLPPFFIERGCRHFRDD